MDPKKFLELAEALVKQTPPEPARLRSATSRAYYAAYNLCLLTIRDLGFKTRKSDGAHGEVVNFLASSKDRELESMSGHLGSLRSFRNNADYDLHLYRAEKLMNVQLHIIQARNIVSTVERCCSGPNRASIIEAMKVFDDVNNGRSRPPE